MAEETIRPEFLDSYRIVTNGRMFRVQRRWKESEGRFWRWLLQIPEYRWNDISEDWGESTEHICQFWTQLEAQECLERRAMQRQWEHDNPEPPWVPVGAMNGSPD